ncbi:TetR/AcrR family transcriptional regulator [Streptomyces sp. NBC_00076]|uniref:TetR/AcrR family transcriptional regulator n=1 Tax=Streptomyces sp. NBC_00076 TaxID=2975642 RepID=UPI00324976F1
MVSRSDVPRRSDAQRNRERILEVALVELSRSADVPLSVIAKKAGVGQGTFYRNFPSREALVLEVYGHGVRQLSNSAAELLKTREPDRALREWMDGLARFAMAKAGLADALRQATRASGGAEKPGYSLVADAIELLLDANHEVGTIRPGVTADDFLLAIAGIWQIGLSEHWHAQAARLLDLIMDGLRAGAPGRRQPGPYGRRGGG